MFHKYLHAILPLTYSSYLCLLTQSISALFQMFFGMWGHGKPHYQVHNTLCLIQYAVKIKPISKLQIQWHGLAFCSL